MFSAHEEDDGEFETLVEVNTLRRERDFADSIVQNVPVPLAVLDAELRVTMASRAFYHHFRVAPAETVGRYIYELGNRQWDIPALRTLLEELLPREQTVENYAVRHTFEHLGARSMLLTASRLAKAPAEEPLIILSIEDITERDQAREDALAELKALRHLQEFSAVLVRGNLNGELHQHILTTALAIMGADMASMQMLDTELGQLRLLAWRGFHPASAAHWERVPVGSATSCGAASARGDRVIVADVESCDALAGTADLHEFRRSGVRGCQSTPLISRTGKLLGMVSTHWREPHEPVERDLRLLDLLARQAADIIERTQAQQALRASEERYRDLFDLSPVAVYSCNASGVIEKFNAHAAQLWGREPALGDTDERFCGSFKMFRPDGSFLPHDQCPMAEVLSDQIPEVCDGEVLIHRPDGSRVTVIVNIRPLKNERGEVTGAINCFYDITERHKLEEMLATRADELAQADRSKDEFLAMLAHELRNPLAPLRNAAELLDTGGVSDEERAQAQRIIGRQIDNMSRMLDDLLDVSRITEGKIDLRTQPVALEAILTAATSLARSGCASRSQKLTLALPAEPIFLNADATRLEQVFGNLLGNACKYAGDGCHIALKAERFDREVVVSVSDDGIGIAPEMLPRVFDLFMQASRTLDRVHGGLGIGLTLVQRLVKLHGGSIEARSEGLGKGAEFIVRLPILAKAPTPAPLAPQPTISAIPRRLLIVDDNTDSARSLATLQTRRGHDTRTAFTGPEALRVAAEFLPEAVLLDIGLPEMDGFEVARQIRAMPALSATLLIAMTGYASDEDRAQCRAAGFDEHLVKPVDLEVLREWLASHPRLATEL
jgi:PAS domain S-box-containing protein